MIDYHYRLIMKQQYFIANSKLFLSIQWDMHAYPISFSQVWHYPIHLNSHFRLIIDCQHWMSYFATSNRAYGHFYNSDPRGGKGLDVQSSRPQGLQNLTNTCYISSVLQNLFLIIDAKVFPVKSLKSQPITYWFFQLKKSHEKKDYQKFKEAVETKIEIVRGWEQQDAQEFFIALIEEISKENPKELRKGKVDLAYKEKLSYQENWRNFVQEMEKIENSEIIRLFYGEIIRQFICPHNQKHVKYTFERYQHLSLPFPQKEETKSYYSNYYSIYSRQSSTLKLKTMIDAYLGSEKIEDLNCEACKTKRTFEKLSVLYTIPPFLVFHLVRFKKSYYDQQKINTFVEFDETMELKEKNGTKTVQMRLLGVINHYGTLHRGHYDAQVRVNDQWYEADDQKVSSVRIDSRGNSSKYVYMLIYQRIK